MIRRLTAGLAALALLALGLIGLPVFLLGAYQALAGLMPDLADLPSVLLAPGDGGLFLLLLFAVGWLCWVVFATAFAVEVIARARGVRTPRLGAFFPQASVARAVSAVALMLTLTPVAAHALTPTGVTTPPSPAPRVAAAAHAAPAPVSAPEQSASDDEAPAHTEYVVARGDTLWDIADDELGDPTRYPEIVHASDDLDQPGGRHLTDPDLILPGWTLHIPTDQAPEPAAAEPPAEAPTQAGTPDPAPAPGDVPAVPGLTGSDPDVDAPAPVTPPRTPMQSGEPTPPAGSAGIDLPPTPLAAGGSPTAGAGGPARAAAAPPPTLSIVPPPTPLAAAGGPSTPAPPDPALAAAAVYDDEGRFDPEHGVLGLPNWITHPLTPVRPEDAPDLVAEAQRILTAHCPQVRARKDATG